MSKGKFAKRGGAAKVLILVLCLTMVFGCAVGGTLAWLMDTDDAVVNTFTDSDLDIELDETDADKKFQMIPGFTIDKDPKVTVKAGSEDCYVFVDIDESENLDDFITYAIADGWTLLEKDKDGEGASDIYGELIFYRTVTGLTEDDAEDAVYSIIGNKGFDGNGAFVADKVLVKTDVTKQMMDELTAETYPTLTFKAYAVQLYKSNTGAGGAKVEFTPAEAWANAQTLNTTP